ncbi:MAG: hypothetical protein H7Z12_06715 [Rhodospirillaceae bacterium]|nr:hypothetical protein [Rhodospirillales bacterium]
MVRSISVLAILLTAAPAWAQTGSWCQGDARNLERELPANDRLLMERRLNDADRMCGSDASRARSDLENLRRDMILQAERPRIPSVGGGSWTEPRRPSWE